jgi:hypothetical protein
MIDIRNSKLVTVIVAVLVSMSAVGMSLTAARTAPEHPPVVAAAVLPLAVRLQEERRHGGVRSIRLRLLPRLRESKVWRRRPRLNLRLRLRVHQWDARGPPR